MESFRTAATFGNKTVHIFPFSHRLRERNTCGVWGGNYSNLAIPGSYINALDFKTVKDLADYLHHLDKNKTAHNHEWLFQVQANMFFSFSNVFRNS